MIRRLGKHTRTMISQQRCFGSAKKSLASSRFAQLCVDDFRLPESVAENVMTPALVVYVDAVRRNIKKIIDLCDGDPTRWRPHVKTTKSKIVMEECIKQGLRHYKCATTREADVLGSALAEKGGGDVLVAFPHVGPNLSRLGDIARTYASSVKFSVLVEDPQSVASVPDSCDIFLDVNIGMNRSGLPMREAAEGLAFEVADVAAEKFRGIHVYDGHSQQWRDGPERMKGCSEVQVRAVELMRSLREAGHVGANEMITAGTPSLVPTLRAHDTVRVEDSEFRRTVSPGTVVFHDLTSEESNRGLDLEPAACVMARVVSHPTAGMITVDAGSKSLAADAGHPMAFVVGHKQWTPLKCSEEHLPIEISETTPPKRGTDVFLIPRHVCPTVNLAEKAIFFDRESGAAEVGYIEARAHEIMFESGGV